MDHEQLKAKLYEFYDGELSKEETLVFSSHLETCRECRSELESWKSAAQASFQKRQISVPHGFSDRVMSRILEEAGDRRGSILTRVLDLFALPKWEVAAALSVSVLVFSYFSINYLKSRDAAENNPVTWVDGQSEPDRWLFSENELEKDDLVRMTVGDEVLNESDLEV